MSCENFQVRISAELDEGLDIREGALLRDHLRSCRGCRDFRQELRQVNEFLTLMSAETELSPPAHIRAALGERIMRGSAIGSAAPGWTRRLFERLRAPWLGVPQWAYALPLLLVAVISGTVLMQTDDALMGKQLAELRDYKREVRENPYQIDISGNPYMDRRFPQTAHNPYQKFLGGGHEKNPDRSSPLG